jgi:ATP-dependent helicase/nuclease subunit B
MGEVAEAEIDRWLQAGGKVVTASERAARSLTAAFHQSRRRDGLKAWPAPDIEDWAAFVRSAWADTTRDARLVLNAAQEQQIWAEIAADDRRLATTLEGPRFHLAGLAMEAHALLCGYAPRFLQARARAGWQNDAAVFSAWLTTFEGKCRAGELIGAARLPLELPALLEADSGGPARPPILLAGFDRLLPAQRAAFDAWGRWQEAAQGDPAEQIAFYAAPDRAAEIAACALWAKQRLAADPQARLLILTNDVRASRGQLERALLEQLTPAASLPFEFSLGVPLSQVGLTRAALLLLRWMAGPLAEHELDWLFASGHASANALETAALQAHMLFLRRHGLQQPEWTLRSFLQSLQRRGAAAEDDGVDAKGSWARRVVTAQLRLKEFNQRPQTPLAWADFVPQLLEDLAWPGDHALSSDEFQAAQRWQRALATAGSLGFDGRRANSTEFLAGLARIAGDTLFAPESQDAAVQIAGPAESAGLTADGVWFLSATEDAWPANGPTHPLLPLDVQREARMPHATPHSDWDVADAITARVAAAGREVCFSYARQSEAAETLPSRLAASYAGLPQPLPDELIAAAPRAPLTAWCEDASRIPFPPGKVRGGASVLTDQSQCPFKAFATARLDARSWEPAEAGLTASQRGQLLHDVLHAVWAGEPQGLRTHAELKGHVDLEAFVAAHVRRTFADRIHAGLRERMPSRYLALEEERLARLVTEWLHYELNRIPFEVLNTERSRTLSIAGLEFDLRLDRLDKLTDGTVLVVDYKSGEVSPRSWDPPRPDDVQLPLYAGFALDQDHDLGGLTFARLQPGKLTFAGRIGDPAATIFAGLNGTHSLMKNLFQAEQLISWRDEIEKLAREFLAGNAEVDPKDYPKTCARCELQTLCRVGETDRAAGAGDESKDDDVSAEDANV